MKLEGWASDGLRAGVSRATPLPRARVYGPRPMTTAPIRAVLFDLDGTLVDNMPFHIKAWIETALARP